METLMRAGAQSLNTSSFSARGSTTNLSPCSTSGSSVQSIRRGSFIRLKALDRSVLGQRLKPSRECLRSFRIRAEQSSSIDEKVREIASDEAVEGPEIVERDAEAKADELESEATELPITADLLVDLLTQEEESVESGVEKEAAVGVASDSAVEDPRTYFHDVEDEAKDLAADLGRSVEDEIVSLEGKAEDLEDRQVVEAKEVNKEQFGEEEVSTSAKLNSVDGELTREQLQEKVVETAKDGFQVLKWAAEGIVSAGQSARQGLGPVQQALEKRLKSFGIAADETKDVSSQVAAIAQKNFQELHTSASKFGDELRVNIDEKNAADSLKPESERNPLAKLNKNLSKVAEAGKDFTTRVSERAEEIYTKSSDSGEELTDKVKETAEGLASEVSSSAENPGSDLKNAYEDERGNEFIKGQISSDDNNNLKFKIDEAQPVPSKKHDETDIGPDE